MTEMNFYEEYGFEALKENIPDWVNMVFPCCGKRLPAPLEKVALVTCTNCKRVFTPKVIIKFNRK